MSGSRYYEKGSTPFTSNKHARVTQLEECLPEEEKVVGSSPTSCTNTQEGNLYRVTGLFAKQYDCESGSGSSPVSSAKLKNRHQEVVIMKKQQQLGMNPSTASHRLTKDILFMFVENSGYKCFRCGGSMSRETFSIEHIEDWLDSENPVELYFDLGNISFSHLKCNVKHSRQRGQKPHDSEEDRKAANRANKIKYNRKVCTDTGLTNRQLQYRRTGK